MSKRIAVVIDPWDFPFNGTVVSTRRFVTALTDRGWRVRLLAIGDGDAEAPGPERIGFPKLSLPGFNGIIDAMRAPLARPDRKRLAAALDGCDLVHVMYPFLLGHAAIGAARLRGLPVLASFHVQPENILLNLGLSSPWLGRLLYRLFVRAFYDRVDRVIAPSTFAAELLHRHGTRTPIQVLSNGVPERFFSAPAAVPEGPPWRILSVGRLAPEKQHETLLRAAARCDHAAEIELILAGTGPRAEALQDLAAALGLRARIGPVSDEALERLYGDAHLFVHCGTIELEGMAVLEAMAAARTVILCDAPASASARFELPDKARFRVGDVAELQERIDHWLDNAALRRVQGLANRALAAGARHDDSVDQLITLYRSLLGEDDGATATGTGGADAP